MSPNLDYARTATLFRTEIPICLQMGGGFGFLSIKDQINEARPTLYYTQQLERYCPPFNGS